MQSVRIAQWVIGPIPHSGLVQLAATKQRNHYWALFIDVLYTLTYITKIPVDECVKRMDDLPTFCVLPIGLPPSPLHSSTAELLDKQINSGGSHDSRKFDGESANSIFAQTCAMT